MRIEDGLLIGGESCLVKQCPSPNFTATQPSYDYLVIHYTAGRSMTHAVDWLRNPLAGASAHLVIGRDASITQLVPFTWIAWHAGKSKWDDKVGLNRYSIGIELDNAGRLVRHGDRWRAWFGDEYEADEVLVDVSGNYGWHLYTGEQIEVALEVCALLMDTYGISEILGHDEIAPHRKVDPGPAFPMFNFRARLMGRQEDE